MPFSLAEFSLVDISNLALRILPILVDITNLDISNLALLTSYFVSYSMKLLVGYIHNTYTHMYIHTYTYHWFTWLLRATYTCAVLSYIRIYIYIGFVNPTF